VERFAKEQRGRQAALQKSSLFALACLPSQFRPPALHKERYSCVASAASPLFLTLLKGRALSELLVS
jgi:hypothetical protein